MHSLRRSLSRGGMPPRSLLAAWGSEQSLLPGSKGGSSPLQHLLQTPAGQQAEREPTAREKWVAAGWTREAVLNLPNALSLGRALSGPLIGFLIGTDQHGPAFLLLAVSGATDWADGFLAKRWKQSSVLGSYLDPLADKVLICCTVGALAYEGSLPVWLASLVITRDVVLVGGAFVHRMHALGWKWRGWPEYFRMVPPEGGGTPQAPERGETSSTHSSDSRTAELDGNPTTSASGSAVPVAPFVQPLYVSKVNTVFQLGLIGGCLTQSWFGFPPDEVLVGLGVGTGLLTVGSAVAYFRKFLRGELLPTVKAGGGGTRTPL